MQKSEYPFQEQLNASHQTINQYHHYVNIPLIKWIKHPPHRLVDVGCAAGILGDVIKSKYNGVYVVGIEPNPFVAKFARQYLDVVISEKFESIDLKHYNIPLNSFDTAILSDVIEHVYNPWEMMIKLKSWLAPNAQVLMSVPNIRNFHVMADLFCNGQFQYQSQGLMDVTHIRFFTKQTICQLLMDTGYQLCDIKPIIDETCLSIYNQSKSSPIMDIELGQISIKNIQAEEIEEFCTRQFFIHAEPISMP